MLATPGFRRKGDAERQKQLTMETSKWDRLAGAIARILHSQRTAHDDPRRPALKAALVDPASALRAE